MADGLNIHLDAKRAERLREIADASGRDPADYLFAVLDQAIEHDWSEDERRFAEYERTGDSISLEEFMGGLRDAVSRRRA